MRLWEQFKAWRRGEKMIKGASRGRCFESTKAPLAPANNVTIKPKADLINIRVIRADGTVEEIDNG